MPCTRGLVVGAAQRHAEARTAEAVQL